MRFMLFMVLILFSSVRGVRVRADSRRIRAPSAATTETRGGAYSLPMQTGDGFGADEMRLNHYKMQDKGRSVESSGFAPPANFLMDPPGLN